MSLKTFMGLVLIYIFSNTFLISSDGTNTKIDSSSINFQLIVGEDELETNFTFNIEGAQQKWYESLLLATLLGSFFAATIAVASILITNYINKRNANRKQIRKYKSLLFGIYSELRNNERIIGILLGEEKTEKENTNNDNSKGEIEIYIDTVKEYNKIVSADVFSNLQARFIEQCRLNLIDNESFSLEVLEFTSRYIDMANAINNSLKSAKIMQIQTFLPKGVELYDAVRIYFEEVIKGLSNLNIGGNELRKIILQDANRFPTIDPHFEDTELDNDNQKTDE